MADEWLYPAFGTTYTTLSTALKYERCRRKTRQIPMNVNEIGLS